jgi:hypothetical protein
MENTYIFLQERMELLEAFRAYPSNAISVTVDSGSSLLICSGVGCVAGV